MRKKKIHSTKDPERDRNLTSKGILWEHCGLDADKVREYDHRQTKS